MADFKMDADTFVSLIKNIEHVIKEIEEKIEKLSQSNNELKTMVDDPVTTEAEVLIRGLMGHIEDMKKNVEESKQDNEQILMLYEEGHQ